jgi:hypothetical protein
MSIDQISCEREILESCAAKLENKSSEYEKEICNTFSSLLEEECNYLFAHVGCLGCKFGTKVDLKQVGIDSFRSLRNFGPEEKSRKRGYEEKILAKLGESILNHCDYLFPYNLCLTSLREAFRKNKEETRGKLVSVIEIFGNYRRIPGNYLYEFRDSVILNSYHGIHVLFGEDGKFLCEQPALLNRECFLLGFVDSFLGEAALRAAGVIKIDTEYRSVPAHATVPQTFASQRTESAPIIVREKNGSETHILGGGST